MVDVRKHCPRIIPDCAICRRRYRELKCVAMSPRHRFLRHAGRVFHRGMLAFAGHLYGILPESGFVDQSGTLVCQLDRALRKLRIQAIRNRFSRRGGPRTMPGVDQASIAAM